MAIIRDFTSLKMQAVLTALEALLAIHATKHAMEDGRYAGGNEYDICVYPHMLDNDMDTEHGFVFIGHDPCRRAFMCANSDDRDGAIIVYLADTSLGQVANVLSPNLQQPNNKAQRWSLCPDDFVDGAQLIYDYLRTGKPTQTPPK